VPNGFTSEVSVHILLANRNIVDHARSLRYQSGLPAGLVATIIPQLLPYLAIEELSHFTNSLTVVTLMLQLAPHDAYPVAEAEILPIIYRCAVSHLPTGLLLDSVVEFFGSLVAADPPIANRLLPGLTAALEQTTPNNASPLNASRCIGAIVRCEMGLAAATVKDFAKSIKVISEQSPFIPPLNCCYSKAGIKSPRFSCCSQPTRGRRDWEIHVRPLTCPVSA
jgi:hypothetical protein